MTPEQRRKNNRTRLIILVIVALVFGWFIVRQILTTSAG